jgi:SAM-dependent methyltransferase
VAVVSSPPSDARERARSSKYTIDGGLAGKTRLNVIAEVMRPSTTALLAEAGVSAGARCLDVGCGGGHVCLELARIVGRGGSVVGIDLDAGILELARADAVAEGLAGTVEYRIGAAETVRGGPFDVVYARFLLSHVADPAGVVAAMAKVTAPRGLVIVEDIDYSASFCHPESSTFRRYVELYQETVRRRGGDSGIGPALPALLRSAGLDVAGVNVVQPVALDGPLKMANYLTLDRIATAVVAEGVATQVEVQALLTELLALTEDSTTLLSVPRIVQTWGTLPG